MCLQVCACSKSLQECAFSVCLQECACSVCFIKDPCLFLGAKIVSFFFCEDLIIQFNLVLWHIVFNLKFLVLSGFYTRGWSLHHFHSSTPPTAFQIQNPFFINYLGICMINHKHIYI